MNLNPISPFPPKLNGITFGMATIDMRKLAHTSAMSFKALSKFDPKLDTLLYSHFFPFGSYNFDHLPLYPTLTKQCTNRYDRPIWPYATSTFGDTSKLSAGEVIERVHNLRRELKAATKMVPVCGL